MTTESYLKGVIILHISLKKHSSIPLTVLCCDNLPEYVFSTLRKLEINHIVLKDDILPDDIRNAPSAERSRKFGDWESTFFKIRMFELTDFEKIVYLDSDMIVADNIDALFDFPHMSAVPDSLFYIKTTDRLNSGTLVFVPNIEIRNASISALRTLWEKGPFPFGDQDVISSIFEDWDKHIEQHLPLEYNCAVSKLQDYALNTKPKVYHYANHYKPWDMKYGYLARIGYCCLKLRFKTIGALIMALYYNHLANRALHFM